MTWKSKLLIALGIAALIAALLFIIKWQRDIIKRQEEIQQSIVELKKLPGDVTRSEARYATPEDLEKMAKELGLKLDPIRKDLESLGADVKAIHTVNVKTPGSTTTNIASDKTETRPANEIVKNESPDPYDYQKNAQILKLEEPFADGKKVPWGEVKFSAWREKPWDLKISPRNYSVVSVLGQDEEGRHYTYSRFSVETDGKRYDIDINDSKFVEEYPQAKFRFSPMLMLGMDFGTYFAEPRFEAVPNLQLALFSYGKTKILPTWTFLGIGPGYEINEGRLNLMVSPFNYNVGDVLPLVRNLYVGPSLGLDTKGNVSVLGGVRVGL